jgi:hypothetical protein
MKIACVAVTSTGLLMEGLGFPCGDQPPTVGGILADEVILW